MLKVFADIDDGEPPPCWLLAIRGERYELGEALSETARTSLESAILSAANWMDREVHASIAES